MTEPSDAGTPARTWHMTGDDQHGAPAPAMSKPAAGDHGAAGDPIARLLAPVEGLKGVGPAAAALLARLLRRADGERPHRFDLLCHLPVGTIDRRLHGGLDGAEPGTRMTLRVTVTRHRSPGRRRLPHRVLCTTERGPLQLVFFRARPGYLRQALPEGAERIVSGPLSRHGGAWQMVHPELIVSPQAHAAAGPLQPVYPSTEGLGQARLGRWIGQALAELPTPVEWQDGEWLRRQRWPSFTDALRALHAPVDDAELGLASPARRRLAYDELLANGLALALVRGQMVGEGRARVARGHLRQRLLAQLPFELTADQRRALAAIDTDLAAPTGMLHLLQGDVGSGKTVVALLAMLSVVETGAQAALMAPTEVLARQHAATLASLLAPLGLCPVLLTGRERGAGRRQCLAAIASGEARIVVGTHALFQDRVAFADLALAVVDEQHRFGVDQRLLLSAKGRRIDLLVMTATPIPRTLVLAFYGDLATSELRQKPPGRQPVQTRVLPLAHLDRVLDRVEAALGRGELLYWVCPAIAATESADRAAAEARFAALEARFGAVVGLIHGRLPAPEKDRVMGAFESGDLRLLVATTVIEVGIDVAAAGVIVIEQAERFGLAQLHQLRGRVGRGERRASCLLLHGEPLGATARARLEIMQLSDDGFRIAEEDLRLRGPGELLGTRQSGLPTLRLADLAAHADLLAPVGRDVALVLARDPQLASRRGRALRCLLRLFERDGAVPYLRSG